MEATDTNNQVSHIENLLLNNKTNNHGEARESSSFSSFNEMLKDLFPQTHTTNTSLEKIDNASNEASPDYYSDTKPSEYNEDKNNFFEKENIEKETFSDFEKENPERRYEEKLEDDFEKETYKEDLEKNIKKDAIKDEKDDETDGKEKIKKAPENDEKIENKEVNKENKEVNKETKELTKEDEDEKKIKDNKLLAELANLLKELNKLIEKHLKNGPDNKDQISLFNKEFKEKLKELMKSPEFKNILNQLKNIKHKSKQNLDTDQNNKIANTLRELFTKEDNKFILEKIDEELETNQDKKLDTLKELLSEILKGSENLNDKKNIKIHTIDSEKDISQLQKEKNTVEEKFEAKLKTTQNIKEKPLILREDIKPIKPDNGVTLPAENVKDIPIETDINNIKSLETNNAKQLNNTEIKQVIADAKDSPSLNSGKDTSTDLFDKAITDNKAASDTKNVSKANPQFTSYLTKAFNAEENILNKIISQTTLRMTGTRKEINFNLTPPELGEVKISLKEQDGILTAKIKVDNEVIKEIVESNIGSLKTSLNQHLKIDRLEVEVREDADQKNLNFNADNNNSNKKSDGNQNDETNPSSLYYNDNLSESFGLNIPVPEGVQISENGLATVDLIG